ncbi:DUF305 domain-containing protein [Micromonospora sp. NPDC049559]|uniref:DUF305 domain-containing protein n=1 Tax=Micromonospora sp. NPDC049559 TaxID=3155923 RepID=UPI00343258EF
MKGLVAAAAVLLLLSGCAGAPAARREANRTPAAGATGAAGASAGGRYNEADVMFLQMMVTHHGQGLEMVRLAERKATRDEVRTLAAAIDVTQTDEVATMTGWLRSWGRPTEADSNAHAHAHHGGMPATGPAEIEALRQADGADFERKFLNLLVAHQHNAAELAGAELRGGTNFATKELAGRIEASRNAQIKQMLAMLG